MEYLFCAQYISYIKEIQSDTYLAIYLSRGRTLDGQKITAGMLQNPTALQQLVQTEQAYKFLKYIRGSPAYWQHERYDLLATFFRHSNMIFDTVCSRFTLAWNDSSSCTTAREKTVKGWCYEDEYCTKEHISMTKSNYWCTCFNTEFSHSSHNTYWMMHILLVT